MDETRVKDLNACIRALLEIMRHVSLENNISNLEAIGIAASFSYYVTNSTFPENVNPGDPNFSRGFELFMQMFTDIVENDTGLRMRIEQKEQE